MVLDMIKAAGHRDDRLPLWDAYFFGAMWLLLRSFYLGGDELVALAVDVDDLDRGVILEVFAELGDVHVHRAGVEVVVIDPDGLEGEVALKNLVDVGAEEAQKLALLGGQLGHLVIDHEHLFLGIKGELADLVHRDFLALLALDAAQDGFDTEHQLLHGEWLSDVVVGTDLEAFEDIVLERLGSEEYDGDFGVDRADFLGESESVLLGHHHVEDAQVVLAFKESLVAGFAVGVEVGVESFCLEILAQQHA